MYEREQQTFWTLTLSNVMSEVQGLAALAIIVKRYLSMGFKIGKRVRSVAGEIVQDLQVASKVRCG